MMHLIMCLDNRQGMSFNGRKQSRDRVVDHDIAEICQKEEGEFVKIEHWEDSIDMDQVESVIVYCWNKKYPADEFCPIDFSTMELVEEEEFPGYSHDKITRRIYRRTGR